MARAVSLSIVFLLIVGPHSHLSCLMRCDPTPSAMGTCHRADAPDSALIAGSERCDAQGTVAPALVREDAQRNVRSGSTSMLRVSPDPRFERFRLLTDILPGHDPNHLRTIEIRPSVSALRI